MLKTICLSDFVRRTAALTIVLGTGVAMMSAQTASAPTTMQAQPTTLLEKAPPVDTSNDPAMPASTLQFSTSAAENADAGQTVATLHPTTVNFAEAMQYGGGQRRKYGNPRYRGGNSNPDGSKKYIFYAGVGLSQPIGNTFHYLTPSYAFQFGGGRQFSKNLAVPVQFDYDHFGFAGQTLGNQTYIYNSPNVNAGFSGLDGTSHALSFSVDPTYTLIHGEGFGAYAVVGVGFYHKTANFTVPAQATGYSPYYGLYTYTANETVDKYTSNAPGFSGGFGLTYKYSRFADQRFYAEVRYVFVDDSQRHGITVANVATITPTTTDFYPANSNRTTYFPVKFGIRF